VDSLTEEKFIERVEGLIDPEEVGDLGFIQKLKVLLPKALFKRALFRTARKYPYIGFVIEPYSLFLFFKLKDLDRARSLLPARYELAPSRIAADEEPGYYHGMGILNTRGSTFAGVRLESYLIARDRETGLVSWIFIDIFSNTLISLPRDGVVDRNSRRALFTTNSRGDVFVDIAEDATGRRLRLRGSLSRGVRKPLDRPLWLGGNTSIAYTPALAGGIEAPFAVIFDPAEVDTALEIPVADIDLRENGLMPGLAEAKPAKVLCFPFAQHYIADSPGRRTYVKDEAHMEELYRGFASRPGMKTFATAGIKKLLLAGALLSVAGNIGLALALIAALGGPK
jgi:hypothetical protein